MKKSDIQYSISSEKPTAPAPFSYPENFYSMTPDEKYEIFCNISMTANSKTFISQEVAETFQRRSQRWMDVLALKEPDRVPAMLIAEGAVTQYAGITQADIFYSPEKLAQASLKFQEHFQPDYSMGVLPMSGRALDLIGYTPARWPGSSRPNALPENTHFQYVEHEYMSAEDYDQLIANPDGYMLRTYIPRAFENLKGFEILPSLYHLVEITGPTSVLAPMAMGPLRDSLEKMLKAANIVMEELMPTTLAGLQITWQWGAPGVMGGITFAPFDIIGDTMRGTRGIMLDMYNYPDKLIAACEAITPISIQMAVESSMATGNPYIIIPLHKGADGFMSNEQFEKFYWPSLKAQLLGIIEAGLIPIPFVEGSYNQRLDIIAESGLPAGKIAWMFDKTDMKAAKKKIGSWACIGGNVPTSLFLTGTSQEMENYCKNLMDIAAPGGGFFLAPGASVDHARFENVSAFINSPKKYGVY
jgi:uroporphyrinogen-III decarboxylase